MEYIDYYKILGIGKTATAAEIKKAYRKLAQIHHPDLNPNDKEAEKRFQQINEANEVLSDPEKRKKYDQYGKDWKHADEFEKARHSQNRSNEQYSGEQYFSGEDFSDFFTSMFGGATTGRRGRQVKFKGQDYSAELQMNLTDVFQSQKQTLTVNGKKIRITIPSGIEDGQVIKIAGHGGEGANGGLNGDLFIHFKIINNTSFGRDGADLFKKEEIDLYTAVLGGEVVINTINGKVKLKIKPGTQNGSKVKLHGKGMPIYKKEGQFGNLIVTFSVKIPVQLSEREKELFTELVKIKNH